MKPQAAIIYLTRSTDEDVRDLKQSLRLLDVNFNDRFSYPVIVFHEDLSDRLKDEIQGSTRSRLTFAALHFELPGFLNRADIPDKILGRFSIGYRHMCRFFSGLFFDHPALQPYEWYWRLDTDSFLRGQISYDVFQHMEAGGFWYGYIVMLKEKLEVGAGLWEWTQTYARQAGVPPAALAHLTDKGGGWNYLYYYNNFEICRLAFLRSMAYRKYFQYLDRLGGIFRFRWGDAPIRTLAVAMLLPSEKVHQFTDVAYSHAGYYTHWRHQIIDKGAGFVRRYLLGKK